MFYMFPVRRSGHGGVSALQSWRDGEPNRVAWPLRNYMWAKAGRCSARGGGRLPVKALRYQVIDGFCEMWRFKLENLVKSNFTVATRPDHPLSVSRRRQQYTFSLWAFPEENYAKVLPRTSHSAASITRTVGYRTTCCTWDIAY